MTVQPPAVENEKVDETTDRAAESRRRRRRAAVARAVRPTVPVVALIGIWWVLTETVLKNPRIFPTPPQVADELVRILSGEGPLGSTYVHMAATAERVVIAFAIAYTVGTVLGVAAGRVKGVYDFLSNLVWIGFAVPSVVWAFIFLVIIGLSNVVPITALAVLLTAPVLVGTAEGIKAVPQDLVAMAQAYRASLWDRFTKLYLPSVLPFMMANARIALALALKIVIIAEVVGLTEGVGLVVRYWHESLYMAPEIAWAIIFITVGLLVDRVILAYFERRARKWLNPT